MSWPTRRCRGFASLPVALRERRIAYKTGTSAGFRDAWAAGYSANWTVVVWVGHADGTPRPGQLGRLSALPILFKAFGRLPAEDNRAQPPPADVLRVASWRELPLRMRSLGPAADGHGAPRIAYPPADARIELGRARGRAAVRPGRRGPPALADRRPSARRHQVGARRARHARASRWSTRPAIRARSRCASSSGARAPSASATDATSSTAKATLIDPVGARLAEEARQRRAGQQPGDVDRGDDQRRARPS